MDIPRSAELDSWVRARATAIAECVRSGQHSEAVGMVSADPWPDLGRVPLMVLALVMDAIDAGHRADFVECLTKSVRSDRHFKRGMMLRTAAQEGGAS